MSKKKYSLLFDEDSSGTAPKAESNWAVSYADMVTLLLCFFILFFGDKRPDAQKKEQQNEIMLSISNQFQKSATSSGQVKGGTPSVAKVSEPVAIPSPTTPAGLAGSHNVNINVMLSEFKKITAASVHAAGDQIELQIADVEFFNKGSVKLTSAGVKQVKRVYDVLRPFQDQIFVEIIGHSDPTPISASTVRHQQRKFTTNLELSTLRALGVFNYAMKLGMPADSMVISGYSDSLPLDGNETDPSKNSVLRRISFTIKMKNEFQLRRSHH